MKSVRQKDAEDANLDAFEFAHDKLRRLGKCFSGLLVDYVGGQPFEMRLAHSLPQHVRTKVELMITDQLTPAQKAVYNSWGKGKYDARYNFDGLNGPSVVPPAYGLRGVTSVTYTGEEWRDGGNTIPDTIFFEYSTSPSTITSKIPFEPVIKVSSAMTCW